MKETLRQLAESLYENANVFFDKVESSDRSYERFRSVDASGNLQIGKYEAVKYFVRFSNVSDIRFHFENWITAYSKFVFSRVCEGDRVADADCSPPQVIVWRAKPSIEERDGYYYVKARLFIMNAVPGKTERIEE